ncbi:MAG: VOC family protein [Jiangellaceae bacterium]
MQGPCGWLKDRYGVSWQIVPTALNELVADPDPDTSNRVMTAMLGMGKIEIQGLRAGTDRPGIARRSSCRAGPPVACVVAPPDPSQEYQAPRQPGQEDAVEAETKPDAEQPGQRHQEQVREQGREHDRSAVACGSQHAAEVDGGHYRRKRDDGQQHR